MKNKTDFLCSPINLFIAGTSSNNSKYASYTTSPPEFCSSLYSNETHTKESNVSSTATCFNSGIERQSLMNNDNVSSEANRQSSFNDGLDSHSFKVEKQSLLNNGSDFRSSEVERFSYILNIGSDQTHQRDNPYLTMILYKVHLKNSAVRIIHLGNLTTHTLPLSSVLVIAGSMHVKINA